MERVFKRQTSPPLLPALSLAVILVLKRSVCFCYQVVLTKGKGCPIPPPQMWETGSHNRKDTLQCLCARQLTSRQPMTASDCRKTPPQCKVHRIRYTACKTHKKGDVIHKPNEGPSQPGHPSRPSTEDSGCSRLNISTPTHTHSPAHINRQTLTPNSDKVPLTMRPLAAHCSPPGPGTWHAAVSSSAASPA